MLNTRRRYLTTSCCKVVRHCCIALPMGLCLSIAWAGGGLSGGNSGGCGAKAANHTSAAYMAYAAAALANARNCVKNTTASAVGPVAASSNTHFQHNRQLLHTRSGKTNNMAKASAAQSPRGHSNTAFLQTFSLKSSQPSSQKRHLEQRGSHRQVSRTRYTKPVYNRALHPKERQRQKRAAESQVLKTAGTERTKSKPSKAVLPSLKAEPYKGKQGRALAAAIKDHSSYETAPFDYEDEDSGLEQALEHLTLQEHLQESQRQQLDSEKPHEGNLHEEKYQEKQPVPAHTNSQVQTQYLQGWQAKTSNIAQMALMALASVSSNHPIYPLIAASGILGLNLHSAGAQQAPMFTETPQNITQPCCNPAVFHCSGEGNTVGWQMLLPGSSAIIYATDDKVKAKGIDYSLETENGQASSQLSVPTHTGDLNGLQVRCQLFKASSSTSNFATLTIEANLGAAQNLHFSGSFSELLWEAAPTHGLSCPPTYDVNIQDLSRNKTLINLFDQPCCATELRPLLIPCHTNKGSVTAHIGNLTGPTATIEKRVTGVFFTVEDVSLDTASNATTDYLRIHVQQFGLVRCPMQSLRVSYDGADTSPYQTNMIEVGSIQFPTQTKQSGYSVTAIILDEFGNPQNTYSEFVGTPPEATSTTDTASPASQIILATLTQTPGSGDQSATPATTIQDETGTTPETTHETTPTTGTAPTATQVILTTLPQAPASCYLGTQPTTTMNALSITSPPTLTPTQIPIPAPTQSMDLNSTEQPSEPGNGVGEVVVANVTAFAVAISVTATAVVIFVIVKKQAGRKALQRPEPGTGPVEDVEMGNLDTNNLINGQEWEEEKPAGDIETNTAF